MKQLLAALLMFSVAGIASQPCDAATLRGETHVNGPVVKLSDVFDGLPDGVDADIARAPAPGKSIVYNASVLTHLSKQYKLDWQPQEHSDHMVIVSTSSKITGEAIKAAVVEKTRELQLSGEIEVVLDNRAMEVTLPGDRVPDFTLNNFTFDSVNKRFRADVSANSYSGPVNVPVAGRLTIRKSVPVLTRRLETGILIGASDIEWVTVSEDRMNGIITDAEQLIGRELRHDVDGGQPVRERDVMMPRLVMRGALVTIKVETPLLTVTAQGRALQDGKHGDVVRVTNTQSNRTVEGIVESSGVIRIPTAQKFAAADVARTKE